MSESGTVALVRCGNYGTALEPSLSSLFRELGGLDRFVRSGMTVLIKPNLLSDRDPSTAVVTHPELVRCLIRAVKALGATVRVGDSPASIVKLDDVWTRTGYRALCEEEGVELVNFEASGSTRFTEGDYAFSIANPVLEADLVLNAPKLKTHVFTTFTAGVKNLYGTVPGFQKTNLHRSHPSPSNFGKLLAEIYRVVRPGLTVVDAIDAMQGSGPSGGDPVHLGFLAASPNAHALDLALCRILYIPVRTVSYLQALSRLTGLNTPSTLTCSGHAWTDLVPEKFEYPKTLALRMIPDALLRPFQPFIWIRPRFTDAFVECGRCVSACPVHALSRDTGKPELDSRTCIGCCCCHEICPAQAVEMVQSPLLRLVRGDRLP